MMPPLIVRYFSNSNSFLLLSARVSISSHHTHLCITNIHIPVTLHAQHLSHASPSCSCHFLRNLTSASLLSAHIPLLRHALRAHYSSHLHITMTQNQQYTDNDERQPLLTTITQPTTENNIEFDQQMPTTSFTTNDQHDDDDAEARWLAELQQRPWYNRPSHYWLMPWLVLVGIMISLSTSSIEQLKIKTVCAHLLGLEDGGAIPGNFMSAIGDVRAFDPIDPCGSKEVLGFVGQLDGNIGAVNGIFSECQCRRAFVQL